MSKTRIAERLKGVSMIVKIIEVKDVKTQEPTHQRIIGNERKLLIIGNHVYLEYIDGSNKRRRTTQLQKIMIEDNTIYITTCNSIYKLEIIRL